MASQLDMLGAPLTHTQIHEKACNYICTLSDKKKELKKSIPDKNLEGYLESMKNLEPMQVTLL